MGGVKYIAILFLFAFSNILVQAQSKNELLLSDSLIIIISSQDNLLIKQAEKASQRIFSVLGYKAKTKSFDILNQKMLVDFLAPYDIFLSSVPYQFNPYLTDIAIESKTSMVDLGGHTLNVRKQLLRDDDAKKAGITIVPDNFIICPKTRAT